ncbi:hypothetical protein EZS27_004317 [termite gut metagenome]|uniref:Twin-arginine translocation signal domain-containing protein n=1 Tax=termite gut metagenome TaxID=433724 RepID=A0A5J4SPR3_9ZZZZ
MKEISRKKFLRVCGTIVAGGALAGVSGVLIDRNRQASISSGKGLRLVEEKPFVSPYRLVSSFTSAEAISGFAQYEDRLYVATFKAILVFDTKGRLLHQFPAGEEEVRDIAVNEKGVYLLHPASISVYTHEGEPTRGWEACSELSNYCSFALTPGFVFVTDVDNKNICKYSDEGNFVKFISSPNGFIIPSLTFGIEYINGVLYCSNSGRHQVETYTLDGEYLGSFGKPGGAPGLFTGCCNPVYLSYTSNGDVITSEKGDPRISCYGSDGSFRSLLLDSKMLGGGNAAYDVKVWKNKMFVSGKNMISIYQYDTELAANAGTCGGCGIDCPLRTGVTV